jgi:hypothetical protein
VLMLQSKFRSRKVQSGRTPGFCPGGRRPWKENRLTSADPKSPMQKILMPKEIDSQEFDMLSMKDGMRRKSDELVLSSNIVVQSSRGTFSSDAWRVLAPIQNSSSPSFTPAATYFSGCWPGQGKFRGFCQFGIKTKDQHSLQIQ